MVMALTVLDSYVVADGVKSKTGLYCELPLALARAAMEKLKTDKVASMVATLFTLLNLFFRAITKEPIK